MILAECAADAGLTKGDAFPMMKIPYGSAKEAWSHGEKLDDFLRGRRDSVVSGIPYAHSLP